MLKTKNGWSIVYDRAIRKDGSLFFPERHSIDILEQKRREMGSYKFSNQMLNEIIPDSEQEFKKAWIQYYDVVPDNVHTFAFIDPAISLESTADFTAVVIVSIDPENNWYVRKAKRFRITATETIELIFEIYDTFKPKRIGVETVAYQQSLMHFLQAEVKRTKTYIPIEGIKRGNDKSKQDRIRGLIPRFEWGSIFLNRGLVDLEDELSKFPRGANDDLIDALEGINTIAFDPQALTRRNNEPAPSDAENYEKHYIQKVLGRHRRS